jgi:hypothetical protein
MHTGITSSSTVSEALLLPKHYLKTILAE